MNRAGSCCAAWLLLLVPACTPVPSQGLVLLNPSVPERPFFHDFGVLPFGSRADRTVRFRNTDAEPVTVLSVDSACSCTRARSITATPDDGSPVISGRLDRIGSVLNIPPGAEVHLAISVNTYSLRPNVDKLAIMRVRTSSPTTPFITLECHIFAERLFTVHPGELRLGDIPIDHGGSRRVEILVGNPDLPAKVLEVISCPPDIQTTLEEFWAGNELRWGLTARVPPLTKLGPRHEVLILSTTDAAGIGDAGQLEVQLWANVVPNIRLTPSPLHFGAISQGVEATREVTVRALVPGARIMVLDTRLSGPQASSIAAHATPLGYVDAEGRCDRWTVTLTSRTDLDPGRFEAQLTVDLDDPEIPSLSAEVLGFVR